jgi:hypothetical protein
MTEREWLTETSRPQWMACYLGDIRVARSKAGRRKLRLFACGCGRVVWDILPSHKLRAAVAIAERVADGEGTKDDLAAVRTLTLQRGFPDSR